jgi:hypothetical protein
MLLGTSGTVSTCASASGVITAAAASQQPKKMDFEALWFMLLLGRRVEALLEYGVGAAHPLREFRRSVLPPIGQERSSLLAAPVLGVFHDNDHHDVIRSSLVKEPLRLSVSYVNAAM